MKTDKDSTVEAGKWFLCPVGAADDSKDKMGLWEIQTGDAREPLTTCEK